MAFDDCSIGDVAKLQGGYAFKSQDFTEEGIPVVKIKNVRARDIDLNDAGFVDPLLAEQQSRFYVKSGDVLISMTGSGPNAPASVVGRVARHSGGDDLFLINQRVGRFIVKDRERLDPRFLYFYMSQPAIQDSLVAISTGSANQVNISSAQVESLPLRLPGIAEQRVIANLLGTLDDKIELNRQMNETLEAMAQALFKSWFVDFDPVIDNALAAGNEIPEPLQARAAARQALGDQRKPLPPEIQAQFPSSFVFTDEMGWIPEGWSRASIYSLIKIVYGAPFKSSLFNEDKLGLPIIRIRDLKTGTPKVFSEEVHPKGTKVERGSLLVGMDAEFRATIWKGETGWVNQRVFLAEPAQGADSFFIQNVLVPLLAHEENAQVGTTVAHLGKKDIDKFDWLEPSESLISSYSKIATPMLNRWVNIHTESQALTALRDTLLPKLLSGELRVADAEQQVSEAL